MQPEQSEAGKMAWQCGDHEAAARLEGGSVRMGTGTAGGLGRSLDQEMRQHYGGRVLSDDDDSRGQGIIILPWGTEEMEMLVAES